MRLGTAPDGPAADGRDMEEARGEASTPAPEAGDQLASPIEAGAWSVPVPNTSGVDALFEEMAHSQQPPGVPGKVSAAGETLPAVQDEAGRDGFKRSSLETPHGRSYAAIPLLVLGPLAFYRVRQPARGPRTSAQRGSANNV